MPTNAFLACQLLGFLMKKGAVTSNAGLHARPLRNSQALRRWRILPARGQLAVRKIKRLPSILLHRRFHCQCIAA
eukprot:6892382-Pyramimonas_sp.AAC.1